MTDSTTGAALAPATRAQRNSHMGHSGDKELTGELEPAKPDESRTHAIRSEELVMVCSPGSPIAEQYRRMRNSIQAMNPDGAARSILLTSAIEGEGNTITALNLAAAMAELPQLRVCLVDGNMQHPSVESYLGMPLRQGISELLRSELTIDQAIRRTSIDRLDVIGAGVDDTSQVLNVDRMHAVLNALKRRYDFVLIDAPPVLVANHPSLLATVADGILLVVRLGTTPKQLVEEAFSMLENLGGNLLGTCATAVEDL